MLRDVMHNIQVVESYLLKSPHTNGGTSVPFSFKNKINVVFTRVLAICGILVWSWALHPHFIQQIQLLRSLRSKRHFFILIAACVLLCHGFPPFVWFAMWLFCFCDQAMCVLLLSRDSALCFFPGLCHYLFYLNCFHLYISSVPHLTFDLFLLCLVNSPCLFHLCLVSVPPSIYSSVFL